MRAVFVALPSGQSAGSIEAARQRGGIMSDDPMSASAGAPDAAAVAEHFRTSGDSLRRSWLQRARADDALAALGEAELERESQAIYDVYVGCLDGADLEGTRAYARQLAERSVLSGMTMPQILHTLFSLRDILGASILDRWGDTPADYVAAQRAYEPAANDILATVFMSFVEEQERVVAQQANAIQELSTPVLPLREHLLVLPIIGLLDSRRALQLTEQLLRAVRDHRAKVVVIDITGVAAVDSKVANHLLQTVDACGLMGAKVIISGISAEIAQTIVTIGVDADLARLTTMADLQSAVDQADRLIGYRVIHLDSAEQ